jgi:hypothetical protein
MTAVGFDTHAMVKQLLAAGFTDNQAEAVTLAVRNAQGAGGVDLSAFATKADLQAVQSDLKSDLAETKAEIFKVMLGQTLVIIGAVVPWLN